MQNAELHESQAGIKTVKRNSNNLGYTDGINLVVESKKELRASWWDWRRRVKIWLKTQHSKKVMASGLITSWQIGGEKVETVTDFLFLDSNITADSDCSQEIKRCFLLGRKAMTTLDSILKSRDITLPTKVFIVKSMVFPVVMYGCKSWTIEKAKCWRIDVFELWWSRRLLRVPRTVRRSNYSILREINSEYSLEAETPILWPPDAKSY